MWNAPADIAERYYAIVKRCLTDEEAFKTFKSNPHYNSIVGQSLLFQAPLFVDRITRNHPAVWNKVKEFMKNDLYGKPDSMVEYIGLNISPNTLRHMATVADIHKHFGSLDGKVISELGVGYGGLAYMLNVFYKPSAYYLLDLPDVQKFAIKYLAQLNVVVTDSPPPESVDLFISEFCLSEFQDEQLYKFYDQYVKNAKEVYLMMNLLDETRKQNFITRMNEDFDMKIIPETHGTNYPCYIIIGKK